jgi:hypothetical protein
MNSQAEIHKSKEITVKLFQLKAKKRRIQIKAGSKQLKAEGNHLQVNYSPVKY